MSAGLDQMMLPLEPWNWRADEVETKFNMAQAELIGGQVAFDEGVRKCHGTVQGVLAQQP